MKQKYVQACLDPTQKVIGHATERSGMTTDCLVTFAVMLNMASDFIWVRFQNKMAYLHTLQKSVNQAFATFRVVFYDGLSSIYIER